MSKRKDDSIRCMHTLCLRGYVVSPHVAFVDTASCLGDQDQSSIKCGTPVLRLSAGCRTSCNGRCWGFVRPCKRQEAHVRKRLHVSRGAHGKTNWTDPSWWEGFFSRPVRITLLKNLCCHSQWLVMHIWVVLLPFSLAFFSK